MIIESSSNKLVKEVKSLFRKKNRDKTGLYLVEGINMVAEILDNKLDYRALIYSDKLREIQGGEEVYRALSGREDVYQVTNEIFQDLSDTLTPQGVLGICRKKDYDLGDIGAGNTSYIFLDGLQDPGNMGTIIRTAEAFGLGGIILNKGSVDPYNPKVVRATMGSIFRLPIYYVDDPKSDLARLKERGFRVLATSLESSNSIRQVDFRKTIIVIGNESLGVSDDLYDLADQRIKIEMLGKSESLNAAVAASIIMYESSKY